MTLAEVLQELEASGTEQTQKTYKRHGAGDNLYGVSYASFGKLQKKIKVNQPLAEQLWATGNYDARILATMIADPQAISEELLEAWVHDLYNYSLADALSSLVSRTAYAQPKMEQWTQSSEEWVGRTGWLGLANLAMQNQDLPDGYFEPYLDLIRQEIHTRKNYIRHSMNTALIAIGARTSVLEQKALTVAAQIGKVVVNHGDTGCKTPDAAAYILKTNQRKQAKAKKA